MAFLMLLGKKVFGYFDNEEKSVNPYNLKYLGKETSEDAFYGF